VGCPDMGCPLVSLFFLSTTRLSTPFMWAEVDPILTILGGDEEA
jgi:hypothetical protein